MTFDVLAQVHIDRQYDWQDHYEIFCKCRGCFRTVVFHVALSSLSYEDVFSKQNSLVSYPAALNQFFDVETFVGIRDMVSVSPPDYLPEDINRAFREGAACLSVGCNNAAGTMFRLCIDLATRQLLPDPNDAAAQAQPNSKQRRDLGLRLQWLFDNRLLPSELRDLATCIREDGNDSAHQGTLTKEDASDLVDFTSSLLERLITEPKKLQMAEARKIQRRQLR